MHRDLPIKCISCVVQLELLGAKLEMGVRAEQQALAKWGLNYVIDEYLPRKLDDRDGFLP